MTSYEKNYRYANDDESTVTTAVTTETAPPVKHKRKIRFSLTSNQIFPIPHLDDMDDEEIAMIWYEASDYDKFKGEIILILRKMMKGEKIRENNKQTARGLEIRLRLGVNHRQKSRTEAIAAVLNEQYGQCDEGVQDDEYLADVYRKASSQSHDAAYELGLEDEAEIKKELQKMRSETNLVTSSKLKTSDATSRSSFQKSLARRGVSCGSVGADARWGAPLCLIRPFKGFYRLKK
jgi:hypothetical protein